MKQILLLTFILVSLLALYYVLFGRPAQEENPENPSVILTTFGDQDEKGNWSGEVAPYMEKLTNILDISSQAPMCQKVYRGKFMGQPMLLVIAGTGKVQASACTTNILELTKGDVKEVILSGIAGISPAKGVLTSSEATMIGDVCINSHAVDFASQYYSADTKGTSTSTPTFWGADSDNISTKTRGSIALAQELYDATFEVSWPQATPTVAAINTTYHAVSRSPKAWGPGECLEASDDLFWHDTQSDLRARQMGAEWLRDSLGYHTTSDNIIVATSMETAAVATVVSLWNKAYDDQIPFAYVRGASNFDQVWKDQKGLPGASGRDSIETRAAEDGVAIASQTASLPVLKMLELRAK